MRFRPLAACLLAALCACSAPGPAGGETPAAGARTPRIELLLNGTWESAPGAAATDASRSDGDVPPADGWRAVRVPEDIDNHLDRRAVWYRLVFTPPAALLDGRQAAFAFERATHHVRVWLNGRAIGEHWGSRLPFEVPAEGLLPGRPNELLLSCHAPDPEHARPGGVADADEAKAYGVYRLTWARRTGGWLPAGLLGDVRLALRPQRRRGIVDVHVPPYDTPGVQSFGITVSTGDLRGQGVVRANLFTLDGRDLLSAEAPVAPGPGGLATVVLTLRSAALVPWDPDTPGGPALYALRVVLHDERGERDRASVRFGHRRYEAADEALLLGGVPRTLLGTASYISDGRDRLLAMLAALRHAGFNAVHTHWDDPGDDFYELCDEAGVYVLPAFYCAGPPEQTYPVEAGDAWLADMALRARAWVALRRNHPSLCMWSAYDLPPQRYRGATGPLRLLTAAFALAPGQLVLGRDVVPMSEGTTDVLLEQGYGGALAPLLQRARTERLPIVFREVADMVWQPAASLRGLFSLFAEAPVVGVIGNNMEWNLFDVTLAARPVRPSTAGHGPHATEPGQALCEPFNWWDPARPTHTLTDAGRLFTGLAHAFHGRRLPPLRFLRSPELLVQAPPDAAGAFVVAEPLDTAEAGGAGAMSYGARLDASGAAWFRLPFPGGYRVSVPGRPGAVVVDAVRTPYEGRAGYEHLLRVALP